MYEVREDRITKELLPKIKFCKNTTCSITELTRENLKFEISAGFTVSVYPRTVNQWNSLPHVFTQARWKFLTFQLQISELLTT